MYKNALLDNIFLGHGEIIIQQKLNFKYLPQIFGTVIFKKSGQFPLCQTSTEKFFMLFHLLISLIQDMQYQDVNAANRKSLN